jgi:hypothetical protein
MTDKCQLSLAPEKLWQSINPWSFYNQGARLGFIDIDLGHKPRPDLEQKLLDEVGSYGRQLGRIGDALDILKGQLAEIGKGKTRERGKRPRAPGFGLYSLPFGLSLSKPSLSLARPGRKALRQAQGRTEWE